MPLDPRFPTSLPRKPGPNQHLTDLSAQTLERYWRETKGGPLDAARPFEIPPSAARYRFLRRPT